MLLAAYILMSWFKKSMKLLTLWQKHCRSVRWCQRTASSYHKRMLFFSGTMINYTKSDKIRHAKENVQGNNAVFQKPVW